MGDGLPKVDFSKLVGQLKAQQLISDPVELITYEMDATNNNGVPDGVVFPESTQDVLKIVHWARENGIPLVSRGAGTGLSGGAVAEQGGLIVAFTRMKRILEIDQVGRTVCVEPGIVNQVLDTNVKKVGLYYPPDPASGRTSTLGGNVSENAGGPHCFKYGVTTNYVSGMEVVLADGHQLQLGGLAMDIPEYDFTSLFTGSEGTLGIITRLDLRLLRNPPAVKTLMAAFENVHAASEAVSAIIARGLVPATLEFMDQKMMRIIEDYAHAGYPVEAGAALIIEVDGFQASLDSQMDEIIQTLEEMHVLELRLAQSESERQKIWFGRMSAVGAMARLSPAYYLLDGVVPRSYLADTLSHINQVCDQYDLRVAYVFHAGDGNLHPFLLIDDPDDALLLERVHKAGEAVMKICVACEGSITGEHGIGIEKRNFMPLMFNQDELNAKLEIKRIFDKDDLLNPGKIFPTNNSLSSISIPSSDQPLQTSYEPSSLSEVQSILRDLQARLQPIQPTGGGTKTPASTNGRCMLKTTRLNRIHHFSIQDLYISVGAGVRLDVLQAELSKHHFWIPLVSPWSEATLGGILSTNFNAPLRMRYGAIRDLLLAAKVVLPDGRKLRLGRPVVKNVAGYNLANLFVGAQGTLGLLVEMTFKIIMRPRAVTSLVIAVEDLLVGCSAGLKLLPHCLNASALLLCRGAELGLDSSFGLLYTAEGYPQDVQLELSQVEDCLKSLGLNNIQRFQNFNGNQIWADWQCKAMPRSKPVSQPVLRTGLPVKYLSKFIEMNNSQIQQLPFLLDIANGLLYTQGELDLNAWRRQLVSVYGYAVILRAPSNFTEKYAVWGFQPDSLKWMKALKSAWDPQDILNRGAFLV